MTYNTLILCNTLISYHIKTIIKLSINYACISTDNAARHQTLPTWYSRLGRAVTIHCQHNDAMDTASSLNTRTGSCVTLYSSDLSQPTVGITIEGAQVQVRLLQCAYYHVAVPLIISRADTRYSEAVSKDRSSTYERKQEIIACTQSEKKRRVISPSPPESAVWSWELNVEDSVPNETVDEMNTCYDDQ